ncbi:hypothetical protein [Pontimicrobium sp. MEBiC01747]
MQKILKIVLLLLGLASIFFLIRIVSAGDEAIETAAAVGDTGLVNPIMFVAYFVLAVTLLLVVVFVLVNLFSNTSSLKKTLISVGAFLVLVVLSYAMATGIETPMQDGEMLSASGSKWVGAGLYMFYFLAVLAGGTMLFTGIKKMIK